MDTRKLLKTKAVSNYYAMTKKLIKPAHIAIANKYLPDGIYKNIQLWELNHLRYMDKNEIMFYTKWAGILFLAALFFRINFHHPENNTVNYFLNAFFLFCITFPILIFLAVYSAHKFSSLNTALIKNDLKK